MVSTPEYNARKLHFADNDIKRKQISDNLEKLKQRGESCATCIHIAPANPQNGKNTYICQLKNITVHRYNICGRHNEGMPPKQTQPLVYYKSQGKTWDEVLKTQKDSKDSK